MSSSTRISKRKAISYVEVDSDVDSDSNDQEETLSSTARGKGDTYGAGSKLRRKRRKVKPSRPELPQEPVGSSKLLLQVPYDLFAELVLHLGGSDVISLGKVNKALYNLIVASSSTRNSIWGAILRRDKLKVPNGMTEIALAVLLYGPSCSVCGKQAYKPDSRMFLRVQVCETCKKQILISRQKIALSWRKLHPRATECVRAFNGFSVIAQLEEAHHKLCDLEAEDEIREMGVVAATTIRSSTRQSSRLPSSASLGKGCSLEAFVDERRRWVIQEWEESDDLWNAMKAVQEAESQSERKALKTVTDRLRDKLVNELEWTVQEVRHHLEQHSGIDFGSNSKAWEQQHETVKQELAVKAAKATSANWVARRRLVERIFKDLKNNFSTDPYSNLFPSRWIFHSIPAVRRLENPKKVDFDEKTEEEALQMVEDDIRNIYLPKVRLETIRALVAARDDIDFSKTSKHLADYPLSTYSDDFFSLATSLFTSHRHKRGDYRYQHKFLVCQYPQTSAIKFEKVRSFRSYTNFRQVFLITAILEAAGFDPDHATLGDLESLEGEWVWTNHPKKSKRRDTYDWISLLDEALIKAPITSDLRSGKLVRFIYVPWENEE